MEIVIKENCGLSRGNGCSTHEHGNESHDNGKHSHATASLRVSHSYVAILELEIESALLFWCEHIATYYL